MDAGGFDRCVSRRVFRLARRATADDDARPPTPLRALAAASAGASVVSTEPSADGASGAAPPALTSKSLGVERGKLLPPVPFERVHWVCDAEGVARMREAVMDPTKNPTTREGYPPVVGLDGEWKPGSRTPVSILQVATRTDAFVVDLFAVAPAASPACDAFDAFLGELLSSETVYKLGFSFGYDLSRMRASYPHLPSLRELHPRALVDVKQLAHVASANRMNLRVGLATLTRLVLGANLSKEQQCSDWSRRPLSAPQLAYAAADAYYLCLIFDKCVAKSNDTILGKRLDDVVAARATPAPRANISRQSEEGAQETSRARREARAARGERRQAHRTRATSSRDDRRHRGRPARVSERPRTRQGRQPKGAVKLLARRRRASKRGGALERWANACAFYLSVGQPGNAAPGCSGRRVRAGTCGCDRTRTPSPPRPPEDVSAFPSDERAGRTDTTSYPGKIRRRTRCVPWTTRMTRASAAASAAVSAAETRPRLCCSCGGPRAGTCFAGGSRARRGRGRGRGPRARTSESFG